MASNAKNRADVREGFAVLAEAALVGTGKPFQKVYGYQIGDFGSEAPVLLVLSEGSRRDRKTNGGKYDSLFRLALLTFVQEAEGSWTNADVEDALDSCEKAIADLVIDVSTKSGSGGLWDFAALEDFSAIRPAKIGGRLYKMEERALLIRVIE